MSEARPNPQLHVCTRVRACARRRAAIASVHGAAWSLVVAVGAVAATHVAVLPADAGTADASRLYGVLLLGLLAGLTVTAARSLGVAADVMSAARAIDEHYELRGRFTTAVDLLGAAAKSPREGVQDDVRLAFWHDVGARSTAVDLRRVAPLAWPRQLAIVLVPLLVLVVPGPDVTGATRSGTPAGGGTAEAPDDLLLTEDLRRVARAVADDAARFDDPYLRALSREFGRLADAPDGERPERSALEGEVDRLLGHLARAYAANPRTDSALARALTGRSETSAAGSEGSGPAGPAPTEIGMEAPGGSGDPLATDAAAETDEDDGARKRSSSLGALAERLEAEDAAAANGAGEDDTDEPRIVRNAGAADQLVIRNHESIDPELLAAEERLRAAQRGSVPAGAASRAQGGGGEEAGEGVDALGEGGTLPTEVAGGSTEDLRLPSEREREGRRITVEAPADAVVRRGGASAIPDPASWTTRSEAVGMRLVHSLAHRDVVARYFLPSEVGQP